MPAFSLHISPLFILKIISLVPSATEIVALLGLQDSLVGISHECDYPAEITKCERLTFSKMSSELNSASIDQAVSQSSHQSDGLFGLKRDRIVELRPDIILTQSICEVCAVSSNALAEIMKELPRSTQLIVLTPNTLNDILRSVLLVATRLQSEERGRQIYRELCDRLESLESNKPIDAPNTAVMLEWLDPMYSAGHWNPEILHFAGAREMIGKVGEKSRRIDWDALTKANPEHLIVACCGYDESRTKRDWDEFQRRYPVQELKCFQSGHVHIMDGNAYFNRPGPRLVDAAEKLFQMLHGNN